MAAEYFLEMLSKQAEDEDAEKHAEIAQTLFSDAIAKIDKRIKEIQSKLGGGVWLSYCGDELVKAEIVPPGKNAPTAAPPKESPKPKTDPPEKENGGKFYAEDLVDHITLGYSAVYDTLKRIHKEEDSDPQANLADVATVLYKNAVDRTCQIISELEKKTGRIDVLIDVGKGYGGYDTPVMGVLIHPKEDPASKEASND